MATTIEVLIQEAAQEARREELPVDRQVYERYGKDPDQPILFAGSLEAPVCLLGRDLGKDEVRLGQPLVGAGGRLVRQGILRAREPEYLEGTEPRDPLEGALRYALLTNTVPFKPPGNKAYTEAVKQRFRPFVLELLTRFWSGHHIITLGTEAFRWFEPYGDEAEFQSSGVSDERFDYAFACKLPLPDGTSSGRQFKNISALPLPHPSPLNRRWIGQFPELLAKRLSQVGMIQSKRAGKAR
jgi:uracil-DNA glycosylase